MTTRGYLVAYPTKIFAGLMFVLAAMWYAGASQNNAANYLLLFTTLAVFLVSIPYTLLNLTSLKITAEAIKPTFAGQESAVPIEIANEARRTRRGCVLSVPHSAGAPELIDEIAAGKAARVTLRFPAEQRGEHELSEIQVRSVYPLGFLVATRRVAVQQRYIVYPNPAGDPKLPALDRRDRSSGADALTSEGDDYAGVRQYVPGESQRHIDWKAVARGQPLMTKQFTAESGDELQLDFMTVRASETEQRLSQLALWVIEAERERRRYGLRLPGVRIPASSGQAHYHRCLHALATFQVKA